MNVRKTMIMATTAMSVLAAPAFATEEVKIGVPTWRRAGHVYPIAHW